MYILSVKDTKSDIYGQPMFFPTVGMAIRSFQDALADNQNAISKHPDDYNLYTIGQWDDNIGKITALDTPVLAAEGRQHKPKT